MLICDECGLVKPFFLHRFIVSAFCRITCAAAQNAPVCGNKIRFGSGHVTSPDAASWTLLKSAVESVVFGWMHFLIFFCSKGFQFCLGKTQHLFGRKSIQNSEVQFICYYPSSFTANTLKWKHRQHLAALVHETHGVLFHFSGSGITLLYQMLGAIGAAT